MANTYTLISSNVLGSSAASVTFSSIPATYTDLVLKVSARVTTATTALATKIRFNSSSSGYSFTVVRSNNNTAGSFATTGNDYTLAGYSPGSTSTSNTFLNTEIYIPNYLISQTKPISTFAINENNVASTANNIIGAANLWSNTNAITSIEVFPDQDNFVANSSFYLYGIKSS